MKYRIKSALERSINKIGISHFSPHIEIPDNPQNGDFTTNVAMLLSKHLKAPPMKIAEQLKDLIIQDQILSKDGVLDHVEIAPPGFINFYVSESGFISELQKVLIDKEAYGMENKERKEPINAVIDSHNEATAGGERDASSGHEEKGSKNMKKQVINPRENSASAEKVGKGGFTGGVKAEIIFRKEGKQRVMIEFADPNPFKEFHIGHLRNITLGESYSRLMEAMGHQVRRVNYQGDVGMHVAKSLWGLIHSISLEAERPHLLTPKAKAQVLGRAYAAGAKAFEEQQEAKQEIIDLNKRVYAQDAAVTALWKEGRQWSLDYFDTIYDRLGTKFTRFYFESEVAPVGMQLVMDHIHDGIFEESDGAVIFRGENMGLHTRVFVSKEKYATYEAKDLALAPLKYAEYTYDVSIIMTGNEQSPYFAVMLAALSKINSALADKTHHIPFGMVNLKEGKMSSRTGNVITADWLIDQAKEKIYAILRRNPHAYDKDVEHSIGEKAAIGAVKYSMLKVGAASDIAFDLDASVSFEGDSGPYIQYTYARARSVLRKAAHEEDVQISGRSIGVRNEDERLLARQITQFPYMVSEAAIHFAPNTLCTYLFHLAQQFNLFYAKQPIVGNDFRLALTRATAQVLKNGLYLLGIETLERM